MLLKRIIKDSGKTPSLHQADRFSQLHGIHQSKGRHRFQGIHQLKKPRALLSVGFSVGVGLTLSLFGPSEMALADTKGSKNNPPRAKSCQGALAKSDATVATGTMATGTTASGTIAAATMASDTPATESENIFLTKKPSSHTLNAIEFEKIQSGHFMPAFVKGFKEARKLSRELRQNTDAPTFENTIMAMEKMGEPLEFVSTIFGNYLAFQTNDELQKLAQRIQPISIRLSNRISFDQNIFNRVQSLYNQKDSLGLNLEQQELLNSTYRSFLRSGIQLPEDKKNRLKEIKERLAKLSLQFGDQLRDFTKSYQLVIKHKRQLKGIPETTLEAAAERAKQAHIEGAWLFTLDQSNYIDIITYAQNRKLRERIWRAFNKRATEKPYDNRPVAVEIAKLRDEYATLLGYKTYGDYVVENRMAKNVDTINAFLDKLASVYKPHAKKDLDQLAEFAGHPLKAWDIPFYSEKLQQSLFSVSDEELRPYFNLDRVINGALGVAERLYGIKFIARSDLPTWDPTVRVYEVRDENNEDLALFYIDPFFRKTKRGGAWMNNLRSAGLYDGQMQRPHVINVYNLAPPTANAPALLTLDDVRTVFHELGHGLHGILTRVESPSLSGTSVAWDAVELPSQIFENWAIEPEVLNQYAVHYKTGETLPHHLIEKVQQAKNFQAGLIGLRQVMLAKIDMAFHGQNLTGLRSEEDLKKWEDQAKKPYMLIKTPGQISSTSFAHIFSGGYASGYYSYKWAEVLAADAYSAFEEKGIFDPELARKFRQEFLERGGVEKPDVLYRRFRGQDPDPDALLRSEGLIE